MLVVVVTKKTFLF